MKKIFLFATMFAVSLSMLAQEYMHVWQDGKKTDYVVTEVDSVTFNKMMHNGHEYVDLGLPSGTLWATCNVGATKPEEYGDYFAWGETAPKSTYNWDTYRWGTYSEGVGKFITKYCTNGNYGIVDNKTTLDLSDDAAHINWGGTWRMPNEIEISELCNNCVKEFTTLNDVQGYKVVGLNGNYIFLPLSGYIDENYFFEEDGYYWSNTLDINVTPPHSYFPNILYFTSDTLRLGRGMRSAGITIRPVCTSLTQREMYVWQNGGKTTFVVADVDSVTFTKDEEITPPTTGTENGYEWVDLGLSVKWATCNVGATKPEEYGDYFAWGEVEPKEYYDWGTYKWCKGSTSTFTKYNDYSVMGIVDGKTTLDLSDDAARANWGGSWRMPTDAEFAELINNCIWTWTTQSGVIGRKVIGPNGNRIFLPAAGQRYDSSLSGAGGMGIYWSRSRDIDFAHGAWYVGFGYGSVDRSYEYRCWGFSVRPVCQ